MNNLTDNTEKKLNDFNFNEWKVILVNTIEKFGKETVIGLKQTINIKEEILNELKLIPFLSEDGNIHLTKDMKIIENPNEDNGNYICYHLYDRILKVIISNIDLYNNFELGNYEVDNNRYKKVKTLNNLFKKLWNKEIKLMEKKNKPVIDKKEEKQKKDDLENLRNNEIKLTSYKQLENKFFTCTVKGECFYSPMYLKYNEYQKYWEIFSELETYRTMSNVKLKDICELKFVDIEVYKKELEETRRVYKEELENEKQRDKEILEKFDKNEILLNFSLRGECSLDIHKFIKVIRNTIFSTAINENIENMRFLINESLDNFDVSLEIKNCMLSYTSLIELLKSIPDSHVMMQTLNMSDNYDGERLYLPEEVYL